MAIFPGAVLMLFMYGASAGAQSITVSGDPSTMTVNTAVAGQDLTAATNAVTTYSVTTRNNRTSKITAVLNSALPAGVTLQLTLGAPTGATSQSITLSTTAQDAVISIPGGLKGSTHSITYQLTSTLAAGVISLSTRSVTLRVVEI